MNIAGLGCRNLSRKDYKIKDVRQTCALSHILFNAYIQKALNENNGKIKCDIKIEGIEIDMLRYADDNASA